MITKEKIEIYKYYVGDVDNFSHASKSHKKIISDEDFFLLTRLLQDIVIVRNGLATKEFQERVEKSIQENCDNQATIDLLKITDPI
jgi:hypothetical protein